MTAGTQTGNKFVRSAEAVTKHTPMGAVSAADFDLGTEHALQRVAGQLTNETSPGTVSSPLIVGDLLGKKLKANIGSLLDERDAAYQDAWQGRGEPEHTEMVPVRMRTVTDLETGSPVQEPVYEPVNMPVDVRAIKDQAGPLMDEMSWDPAAEMTKPYRALEKILKGDDFIPAWQAEHGLSGLKSMARMSAKQAKSGMRDMSQGVASSLIGDLQDGINAAAAKVGQTAIEGLRRGRAIHAEAEGISALAERLRDEPMEVFRQMTWEHDGAINFLEQIAEQAPELMPRLGQGWVQNVVERAMQEGGFGKTQGILTKWRNLGDRTKAVLFPDAKVRAAWDDFFKGAQMVERPINPSGTELVRSATNVNPLRWVAGYLGGQMFYTPEGIRLLTQGIRQGAGPLPQMAATKALNRMGLAYRLFKGTESGAFPNATPPPPPPPRPPLSNFHQ